MIKEFNVNIKPGELIAIIGSTGSGKSSILKSLLKNLYIHKGKIDQKGEISYSPQNPFLVNNMIEQNIIFENANYAKHFKKIIRISGLENDLKSFALLEQTMVGSKGLNMSGG